ncbi:MAG: nuclear transport factor 2 family protein [Ferruginibacter sp.]|nr:nuclear transport factor 2 family protein [Ferruginibacter sp.]
MKKILIASATIFAFGLISCADNTAKKEDAYVTIKENNTNFYKAMENGDEAKLKSWLTDDAIDHNGSPTGEDIVGGDKIVAMLAQMQKSFEPGFKMNIINQAVDGDYLYTLVEMKGTTTANPSLGLPPSTKMDSRSVDVIKLKDGKAQEHWAFMSMPDVMMMMKSNDKTPSADKMDMPGTDKIPVKDSAK